MQNQTDPRTSSAAWPSIREEFFGPPRPTKRAQFSVASFGLLLVATLVLPVFMDTEAMPGLSLVNVGMMLLLGFAELLDASKRRFIIAVRVGGIVIGLLGLVIQML